MKRFSFLVVVIAAVVVGFGSCKKDDTGDVNLVFKLTYGDEPLEMYKNYTYPVTGEVFNFTKFSFFIAELSLNSKKEGEFLVKDLDYLDLTNAHDGVNAAQGFSYPIKGMQVGSYESINFGVGVPRTLNAMSPSDFKSGHLLSNSSQYWTAWKSYIFARPEGNIDFNNDGQTEANFALHLGGDEAYIELTAERPFVIKKDETVTLEIFIDMKKYFNGKSYYDIRKDPSIHSLSQIPLMVQLAENLGSAFSIR